jgi:endonuclease YncB( thermonuclease family)/methylphosphotriester-DNA--protein-cysteine methyltransferase
VRLKIKAALFFVSVVAVCSWTGAQAQQAAAGTAPQQSASTQQAQSNSVQLVIEGKVVNVHDGDTITVLDRDGKKFHIRLQGIDAPEIKQAYGPESQKNLERMVMGKQVTIVWNKVDKYRRTVGTIMLDGKDVNIEQVKAGLAWHFKKYADEQDPKDRVTYAKAEADARAVKLGLWQDPNPTPPGDFRVETKVARWGPAPPEGTVIGNKGSMKYHRPDCPGYRDMSEKNRVFFKSVAEAEAAGYTRAGNCPPEGSTPAAAVAPKTAPASSQRGVAKAETVAAPASAAATTATTAITTTTAATGDVIGNKNSKKYHNPGCPGYNSVSEKNQVRFKSAAEAEAAGYSRAGNCKADDSPASAASTTANGSAPSQPAKSAKATPVAATAEAATAPSTSTPSTAAAAATGEIIANKNSKIYHRPNCPGYNNVSEKNQVRFKTVEEAEAAGYRVAKNCPAQ